MLLHREHGTGYWRSWNCCDRWTHFVVIWKHFCFILSTGTRIRIDSVMCRRSSDRGRNTSASVTVTVTGVMFLARCFIGLWTDSHVDWSFGLTYAISLPVHHGTQTKTTHFAAAVYVSPEMQTPTALEHCLRKSWRSISLMTVQNLISSMPDRLKIVIINRRHCSVLTFASCLEVTLFVVVLLYNFGCCNITEYRYYNSCWKTICIKFLSHNFIDHTYW